MKSSYYVGGSSGNKKNNPSEKWYAINVIRENRYGSIGITPVFCTTEERWKELLASAPPIGSCVEIVTNLDHEPERIILREDIAPLIFDKKK